MTSLAGRIALVTGAGRRVGQSIALALGAEGCRVAVHYHGSKAGAHKTAAALRGLGVETEVFAADLSKPD
ncbi:MAG: SDR family NAD(P)-dependent oxidoreductase, partial [Gemmatimonadota bacterium]